MTVQAWHRLLLSKIQELHVFFAKIQDTMSELKEITRGF